MITNPQVGQKIKIITTTLDRGLRFGKFAHIISIERYGSFPLRVRVEGNEMRLREEIYLRYDEVEPYVLTEAEQDQERRQQHADRYL